MFTVNENEIEIDKLNVKFQNISCLRLIDLVSSFLLELLISKHFMFTVNPGF